MPRNKRIIIPGLPHHVTQRGGRRQTVFFSDEDRIYYLHLLSELSFKYRVEVLAYCLMTNHVHLFLVPNDLTGLSVMLKVLNKLYAYRINQRFGWSGHLWQQRFYSSPVDRGSALAVLKYIERNPVEAGMVKKVTDYKWSSAQTLCGNVVNNFLSKPLWWAKVLDYVGELQNWLNTTSKPSEIKEIRLSTVRDRPYGRPEFISALEKKFGVNLTARRAGRPRKM